MSSVRETLAATADRVADLLDSVHDPMRRATGEWTIADTAAHIREVAAVDGWMAAGIPVPEDLQPVLEQTATVSLDKVPAMNDEAVRMSVQLDLGVIAKWLRTHVQDVIGAGSLDERVSWVGGLETSRAGVLAHLISELLVHGHDIASAERRRFDIATDAARMFFEEFFFDVVSSPQVAEFTRHRAASLGQVSWTVHMRGAPAVAFEFDGATLRMRPKPGRTDLHVVADPAAMLLLMYERMSPVSAAATGKVVVYGRRPWRIRRLIRLLRMP